MTVAPGQPSSAGRVPPHPVCNAFLICDYAIREEGTGKVSLVGVFENINARSFPVTHGLLCVYAKLTDIFQLGGLVFERPGRYRVQAVRQ